MPLPHRVLLVLGSARRTGLGHHLAGVVREELARRGAEVRVHDLLADGFDPRLRLAEGERFARPPSPAEDPLAARYCEDVRWAEVYVLVHPVYWFAPPAILKGWIDRIFVHSVAVRQSEEGPPEGILTGRRALVVQTFGAAKIVDTIVFRSLAWAFWKRAVFFAVGIQDCDRVALYGVDGIAGKELAAGERRLRAAVERLLG
ncbi:MAG: NAD(P)H-dependent oxidoreductase [Planctomycetota bacterium]